MPREVTAAWMGREGLEYSLVMVHLPLVDEHTGVLGDVVAVQHRRFCRAESEKES